MGEVNVSRVQLSESWPFARDRACPVLPPPRLAEIRKLDRLVDIELYDGTPCTLATRYDDVRAIMMHPNTSSDATLEGFPYISAASRANRGERRTMERTDPPRHDELRSMLAAEFTIKKIRAYRPFLEALVERLLDQMEAAGPPADLVASLAEPVPAAVICELLDLPADDAPFFNERVHTWMNDLGDPRDIARAMTDITDYFERLIDVRADGGGQDLVSRLIRDQLQTGKISRPDLLLMFHLLITAGFDTTANSIALGTMALLEDGDAWRQLAADPTLAAGAVEELQRYLSVAHNAVFRLTRGPVEIGDDVIPANHAVIASTLAANHDPDHYPDPARVDLNRDARDHLAFGVGLHQCLGQALARIELQVVFERLPQRFPGLRLDASVDDLRFRQAIVYGVETLPVRW